MRLIEKHIYFLKECPWLGGELDMTKCVNCRFFKRDRQSVRNQQLTVSDNESYWCFYSTTNPIGDDNESRIQRVNDSVS